MNTFNLALVVSFLSSFVPTHEVVEIEQAKHSIAKEFGVTYKTASKWRERAINSGEIEKVIGGIGYKLVNKIEKIKKETFFKNKEIAMSSDKVVNIQIARFKRSKFNNAG